MQYQSSPFVASVIAHKITTPAQLRGLTIHALRSSETVRAKLREGATPQTGLAWSCAAKPRDPYAAFKAHKRISKAFERKGAPICLHLTCSISQNWITAGGSLHDPENPRNIVLFEQAKAWAESWAGDAAVFAVRLDLDQEGGGVVDLFLAPLRDSRGKQVISTSKALKELQGLLEERIEYAALQTSWALWCQTWIDPEIQRGERKGTQKRALPGQQLASTLRPPVAAAGTALEALQRHVSDGEDEDQRLRDYLLLRREVATYAAQLKAYRPPAGVLPLDTRMMDGSAAQPWPVILGMSSGALEVLRAAANLGITVDDDRKRFKASKKYFCRYIDQVYLGAVLAECGVVCAYAEALCKAEALKSRGVIKAADNAELFWPFNSAKTLTRHRNRVRRMTIKAMQQIAPRPVQKAVKAKAGKLRRVW